jgi:peptidoglycan/LPS O-acetylase OafA/YrhL
MSFAFYSLKRLNRLYPMFLIGLAVGFIAIVLKIQAGQTSFNDGEAVRALSLNAFFLPFFHHGYVLNFNYKMTGEVFPFNTCYWSLFFELFVNVCFYFTVKGSKNAIILYTLGLLTFAFTVLKFNAVAQGWGTDNFINGFPRVFVGFFGGVLVFEIYKRLVVSPSVRVQNAILFIRRHSIKIIAAMSIVFLIACRGTTHGVRYLYVIEVLLMPAAVLVATFVMPKSGTLNHVMTKLGAMSYPLYCLHYPILHLAQSINKLDGLKLDMLDVAAIAMVCTLTATYFVFDYVDENVRAYLGRKFLPRT